ncbi:MAG TPA: DUF2480 family protein [Bacteroidia bacterium]|nr:DUF2480 family protein [Bacteroidia bacterium]
MEEIVNRVSESGLLTIDLEELHTPGERVLFDIKGWLFEELILKEKDFRDRMKNHAWESYTDKFVAVSCSADAIVPTWAYMLIASRLAPFAKKIVFGDLKKLEEELFHDQLLQLKPADFRDQRVVIKGCSKQEVPVSAYVELTAFLRPLVKSILYGEPCSTVPVYKKVEK